MLVPTGVNEIYDPNLVKFVPPGAALNVICGVNVHPVVASVFTIPSRTIVFLADVDVEFIDPPTIESK